MSAQSNAGSPAYPTWELNGAGQPEMTCYGLTKRELFSAMAMQALLSDTKTMANINRDARERNINPVRYITSASIEYADALLAELAKGGAQ